MAEPDPLRELVGSVKAYERATVEAALEGSYRSALQALLTHPLVASYPLAKSILDGYLAAHGSSLEYVAR